MKHGELIALIAFKDGKPAGRIAAIINRSHNEYSKDKVGFFGFFDSADDKDVASTLFEAAKEELLKRGLTSMRGPYNPTINDDCGLLVEGFETAPFVMMPYNPAYYMKLYDDAGLKRARDLYAFYMSAENQAPKRVERIVKRVKRNTGVTLRSVELKKLTEELMVIKDLYNATLCRNWGHVPITGPDLEHASEDLKAIVAPDMCLIAEKDGKAVGFSLTIPNINEFLFRTKKSGTIGRILKFIWLLKTKHPKEARLAAMGVHPDFRNTGIAALFYYETLIRGKQKYIGGEMSWVDETNTEMIKSIQVMGGKKYKTYRLFEKELVQ